MFSLGAVAVVLGGGFVGDPGVAGWELEVFFGGDAGLELPAAFGFGVQFGAEK